jgi:hypothetical protein
MVRPNEVIFFAVHKQSGHEARVNVVNRLKLPENASDISSGTGGKVLLDVKVRLLLDGAPDHFQAERYHQPRDTNLLCLYQLLGELR